MHTVALPVQARLDSLLERTEAIGSKTIETFEGRDDHLKYRSVRYGPVERQQSDLKYVFLLSPLLTCFVLIAASSRHTLTIHHLVQDKVRLFSTFVK